MRTRIKDQQIAERKVRFGPDLGEYLFHVEQQWVGLKSLWREYEALFGHSPERVEFLNKSTGSFFFLVNRTFYESTILAICRLTDPVKSAGKPNLTLMGLPERVSEPALREELNSLNAIALEAAKFQRDWRNRRITHNDLGLALNKAEPLKSGTRKKMNAAISAIHAPIDLLYQRLADTTYLNEFIGPLDDAVAVLNVMFDGLEAQKTRNESIESLDFDFSEYEKEMDARPAWLMRSD